MCNYVAHADAADRLAAEIVADGGRAISAIVAETQNSVVFAIQIWHTRGQRPDSLVRAFIREKEILFTRSILGVSLRCAAPLGVFLQTMHLSAPNSCWPCKMS